MGTNRPHGKQGWAKRGDPDCPSLSELDTLHALPIHHLFITFHLRHGIFPVPQTEATPIQLRKVTFDLNVTHCLG